MGYKRLVSALCVLVPVTILLPALNVEWIYLSFVLYDHKRGVIYTPIKLVTYRILYPYLIEPVVGNRLVNFHTELRNNIQYLEICLQISALHILYSTKRMAQSEKSFKCQHYCHAFDPSH